jgi:hypothetical protein
MKLQTAEVHSDTTITTYTTVWNLVQKLRMSLDFKMTNGM